MPLSAATAPYEHLTGPVAANPYRLGKALDVPFDDVLSEGPGAVITLLSVVPAKLITPVVPHDGNGQPRCFPGSFQLIPLRGK